VNKKIKKEEDFAGIEIELAPELQIIIRAAGVRENREEIIAEIIKEGIDWEKLEKSALDHKVLPLLYKQLAIMDQALLLPQEMDRLQSIFRINALRNTKQAQNLHRIIRLLSSADIKALAFKGPALAVQAYNDLSLRTFSDLDFLVHTEDFDKIYDILTGAGFSGMPDVDEKNKRYWKLSRRDFGFHDGVSGLDLHHQLNQGPKRISLDEKAWQDSHMVNILLRETPTLSPEHSLLTLCIHGTKENWLYLNKVADITHLISRHPQLDWKNLLADAEDTGCLRMLYMGLHLSRQICGLQLPGEILESLRLQRQGIKLADAYWSRMEKGKDKIGKLQWTMALIKSLDSIPFKVVFLMDFLFSPTPIDWMTIKLPPILYPLYYILRPLRLFCKLIFRPFKNILKR
jgi:hypothetical protein